MTDKNLKYLRMLRDTDEIAILEKAYSDNINSDEKELILLSIAVNPKIPLELFEAIINKNISLILKAVARNEQMLNKNFASIMLSKMNQVIESEGTTIISGVSKSNYSDKILTLMSGNVNVHPDILMLLVSHVIDKMQDAVSKMKTPEDAIFGIHYSLYWNLFVNVSLPDEGRKKLLSNIFNFHYFDSKNLDIKEAIGYRPYLYDSTISEVIKHVGICDAFSCEVVDWAKELFANYEINDSELLLYLYNALKEQAGRDTELSEKVREYLKEHDVNLPEDAKKDILNLNTNANNLSIDIMSLPKLMGLTNGLSKESSDYLDLIASGALNLIKNMDLSKIDYDGVSYGDLLYYNNKLFNEDIKIGDGSTKCYGLALTDKSVGVVISCPCDHHHPFNDEGIAWIDIDTMSKLYQRYITPNLDSEYESKYKIFLYPDNLFAYYSFPPIIESLILSYSLAYRRLLK